MSLKYIKKICKFALSKLYIPIKSRISVEDARAILNNYSPKPDGVCYADNQLNIDYDLQVVIPVYNSENYLNECLQSILNQKSKYSIIVTIVNDGSTDGSKKILDKLPNSINGDGVGRLVINIINQKNKGYSGARNTALKKIYGNYIMFLDSDDIITPNSIDNMLDYAYENDIDILQGSWYSFDHDNKNYHILETSMSDKPHSVCISGFPWGKLYKHSIIKNFQFPNGYWFEDTPISFILAGMDISKATISDVVYGYRLNPEGITTKAAYNKKYVDSYWVTELCLTEFNSFHLGYNQRAYEYLLNQTLMNSYRVVNRPREIRESIFVLTSDLKQKYFSGFRTRNNDMKRIEKAIENKRFIQYELIKLNIR